MKKSFIKKIMILCFAVFGMVMIGNNVFAGGDENDHDCPDDPDGGGSKCTQYDFDDHILKLKTCILPWQQKLVCSPYPDKCCKAESQKACSGSGWPI